MRAPLLEGCGKSAGSTVRESNRTDSKPDIGRARALCLEALEICEASNLPRQIGAKLQEVVDALDESEKTKAPRVQAG